MGCSSKLPCLATIFPTTPSTSAGQQAVLESPWGQMSPKVPSLEGVDLQAAVWSVGESSAQVGVSGHLILLWLRCCSNPALSIRLCCLESQPQPPPPCPQQQGDLGSFNQDHLSNQVHCLPRLGSAYWPQSERRLLRAALISVSIVPTQSWSLLSPESPKCWRSDANQFGC